jgi:hypothetical protein
MYGVVRHPAAGINGRLLDRTPLPIHTLEALCQEVHYAPMICSHCAWCEETVGCIELGSCEAARKQKEHHQRHAHRGNGFFSFVKWAFRLTVLGGGCLCGMDLLAPEYGGASCVPATRSRYFDGLHAVECGR